jgi:hypothetical protein
MFYYIENDCVLEASDSVQGIYHLPVQEFVDLTMSEYVENKDAYEVQNGELVCISDTQEYIAKKLQEAKDKKQNENTTKAKSAIENGTVTFKNALFETNAQTVSDLTATMLMLQAQQNPTLTYTWLSKDDKEVDLTVVDFVALGDLIVDYKNEVWNTTYLTYKTQIEESTTVQEVNAIEINYAAA